MTEPTIDECITWVDGVFPRLCCPLDQETMQAIRVVLEEHKLRTSNELESRLTVWGYTLRELGEIVKNFEKGNRERTYD